MLEREAAEPLIVLWLLLSILGVVCGAVGSIGVKQQLKHRRKKGLIVITDLSFEVTSCHLDLAT